MKIAYITGLYARASDTFIRNEVLGLRANGHKVRTFSIRREGAGHILDDEIRSEQAQTTYVLEQSKLTLLLAPLWCLLTRPRSSLQALHLAWKTRHRGVKGTLLQLAYFVEAAFVAKQLLQDGTEILHNHIAESSASVAMLASAISGVPFSMTVHGPGIFFHPRHWALDEKIARSSFTACITDFCRSQCMLFSDPSQWHKLHIVRCTPGIAFRTADVNTACNEARFLFVGRLCAEKGTRVLLDAFVKARMGGVEMKLTIVGDGPLREEVEQLVREHDLGRDVELLGWQSSERIQQELERCRAFVLPSFAEGLPVSIMEAFYMGRPVISTQIAGIPELVMNQETGWLVSPGSSDALADALLDAARRTPEEILRMGQRARHLVRARHDFATEVKKLEMLLGEHAANTKANTHS